MWCNCIIILGATASGKTKLSIDLAKRLNGEIINADSQQIIRNLNIGTAKIREDEKQNIAHHLFDIVDVGQDFSVSEFSTLASSKINEILQKGKLPIIVGGTGFYINSIIYSYSFGNSSKDSTIRENYEKLAKEYGNEYVYNILKQLDPESASRLHFNDVKRVIRAIEIYESSGQKKSGQHLEYNPNIKPYIVGLDVDRDILYKRINDRVDKMIDDGLEKEISYLKDNGYYDEKFCQLPIGYSEWKDYFDGKSSREEVISKIKQNSRHYAKRQLTWFRKIENVNWFKLENDDDYNAIIEQILKDITIKK